MVSASEVTFSKNGKKVPEKMKNGKDIQNDKQIPNPQNKERKPSQKKEMESGSMTYHCTFLH